MTNKFSDIDQILIDYFDKQVNLPCCVICNGSNFYIHNEVLEFNTSDNIIVPAVIVVCHKCGNMTFFNAKIAGIIDD